MRAAAALLLACALLGPAAEAAPAPPTREAAGDRGVRDPIAFVRARFASYAGGQAPAPLPDHVFSPRLARLFAALAAVEGGEERIHFDWWVDAPDWEIDRVRLKPERVGRDRLNVDARWRLFGEERRGTFLFVRGNGRWLLDDVASHTSGWTLSLLLEQAAARR